MPTPSPDRPLSLRAGPLTMVFEPRSAFLRYVRLGDHELLRGIYCALRDHNWDTIPPCVLNLRPRIDADSFLLTFDVECRLGPVDFLWHGLLRGDTTGSITYSMDGQARSSFRRNRLGFCVLHPMRDCAGQPCVALTADGAEHSGVIPQSISPHQPFKNLRGFRHEAAPGLWAALRFEGDIFEMEDQRNWTDASFKTYCTPLSLPFPVEVPAGSRVTQAVTLTLDGPAPRAASSSPRPLTLTLASSGPLKLPRIGFTVASHHQPLTELQISRLAALHPSHLRVDLFMAEPDWQSHLLRAADEARALGASLGIALHLDDSAEDQLRQVADLLRAERPPVWALLIFHIREKSTRAPWLKLARRFLPDALLGAGTDAYFAELNRARPPVDECDLVCWSVNPQVHAFDDASLTETLPAQGVTVANARQFAPGRMLAVTPVTLRPRFNPNAAGPQPAPPPGQLPPEVDPRQLSLFGAAWTLGSIKYLAESAVDSITYYETTGWRGLMELEAAFHTPTLFPSVPDAVFPLYHVFADVMEFAGGSVIPCASSDQLQAHALLVALGNRRRLLVANLTTDPLDISLPAGLIGPNATLKLLDQGAVGDAMRHPEAWRAQSPVSAPATSTLHLSAHAVARFDFAAIAGAANAR